MRVLAIGAHPDDLEIACAGTLAKYVERGHGVVMAYVTNGEMGHSLIQPAELARIREDEARKATKVIGAEFLWLGLPDEFVFHDLETRMRLIDVVREAKPDVLITHSLNDYHPDHVAVSNLVFAASFLSSIPHIKTKHDFHEKVPPIFYMDTLAGVGSQPEEYVDITGTMGTKLEALAQHQSQVKWLKEHDKIDILDFVKTVARFRGIQAGVPYAEGFIGFKGWPRLRAERLLP